jgi:hypothetical protein
MTDTPNLRLDRANLDAWRLSRPRPGYLTDFTRRPDPRKLRLGDWLPVLFVALALAVALALYALPTALGWIEGGL